MKWFAISLFPGLGVQMGCGLWEPVERHNRDKRDAQAPHPNLKRGLLFPAWYRVYGRV